MRDKFKFRTWLAKALLCVCAALWMGAPIAWSQTAQQEYKKSWAFYQKRTKQGASRQELLSILAKIQQKYAGQVNLKQVKAEESRVKKSGAVAAVKPSATQKKSSKPSGPSSDHESDALTDALPLSYQAILGDVAGEMETLEKQRREISIGEKVRADLEDVLAQYYDRNTYLVAVQASLKRVTRNPRSTGPQEETGIQLPFDLPRDNSSQDNAVTMAKLLQDAVQPWEHLFKMDRMKITILLQAKKFQPDDKAFISNAVKIKSGFDEMRGDQVVIRELPFPALDKAIATTTPTPQHPTATPSLGTAPTTSGSEAPLTPPKQRLPTEMVGWALAAFGALTFALAWRVLRMGSWMPQPMLATSPSMPGGMAMSMPMAPPPPPMAPQVPRLHEELRQFVNVTVVGNADLSSQILRSWWKAGEAGQGLVLSFLRASDPKLVGVMAPELGESVVGQLQLRLPQHPAPTAEEAETVFTRFREEYQRLQQADMMRAGQGLDRDIFGFMKRLEPQQLVKLFEDEEAGVIAVGLAQLPSETAGRLLKELPTDKRMKVPVEMGRLKKIPATALYDIAERLSKKASGVADIRYVSTDGVASLIDMLEELDPELERQVLSAVQQQDVKLAEEVRKTYVTMPDLGRASEKFLTEFLRSFDREVLAKVIASVPQDLRLKLMGVLPDRLQIMVEEMAGRFTAELSKADLEAAQHEMLAELRRQLRSGKVTMKQMMAS